MAKKIREVLQSQEASNEYYTDGVQSLLYPTSSIGSERQATIDCIQYNLALHQSLVDEFDKDGYDVGNVVLHTLSGFVFDACIGQAYRTKDTHKQLLWVLQAGTVHNSYYRLYTKCLEKISMRQRKNKGKKQMLDAMEAIELQDMIASVVDYTDTLIASDHGQRLQEIHNEIKNIRNRKKQTRYKKKIETLLQEVQAISDSIAYIA